MNGKKILKSINKLITDPTFRFNIVSNAGVYNYLKDEEYLKRKFKAYMGKELDLNNPKTFNEKMQWLKLNNRKPQYTIMADKLKVRSFIAEKIGKEYLIPYIGSWENTSEINFEQLPNSFVIKCNHNSGEGMYICRDKSELDTGKWADICSSIKIGLNQDYYRIGREWPYRDIPRKILCEAYMEDMETKDLRDYKFFCFNGKVKCFKVDFDRFENHRANYYDSEGNIMSLGEVICPPNFDKEIKMPYNLEMMKSLAEKLSESEAFLRVDFYEVNGKVYFGELTFFPASGFGKFIDDKWDEILGDWIDLEV